MCQQSIKELDVDIVTTYNCYSRVAAMSTFKNLKNWRRSILTSVLLEMEEQRWTDTILYSSEGIPVPVHRVVLNQSPFLRLLMTSVHCCQSSCSQQEPLALILPDIPHRLLCIAVAFFYTGSMQFSRIDTLAISVSNISIG